MNKIIESVSLMFERINALPPPVVVGLFVAVFLAGLALMLYLEHRRTQALAAAAAGFGFALDTTTRPVVFSLTIPNSQSIMPDAFRHAVGGSTDNVMSGTYNGTSWKLFDYSYTTGTGKHRHTHRFSVALASGLAVQLPFFRLTTETFLDKFVEMFGITDIDLPEYPEFSRRYALKGRDTTAITALFTAEAVRFFEEKQLPGTVKAEADCFAYFKTGRLDPRTLMNFLENADRLLRLFVH